MIEKEKFGAFVAQLRKEKGLTQKELAEKLFLSDKAVSKWERGLSMPDITILTPLAEALDVTVAELLNCQRMEAAPMESEQVEELVQKAIHFREEEVQIKPWKKPKHWLAFLLTQVLVAGVYSLVMLLHVHLGGDVTVGLQTIAISGPLGVYWLLPLLFGLFFWLIVEEKLPNYYDENRISYYAHNGFKIHLAGVVFNNSNWPHILKAVRIWCTVLPLTAPLLFVALRLSGLPTNIPMLIYTLGTLFIPMYYVGKKYE